jgi:hypothetical protein
MWWWGWGWGWGRVKYTVWNQDLNLIERRCVFKAPEINSWAFLYWNTFCVKNLYYVRVPSRLFFLGIFLFLTFLSCVEFVRQERWKKNATFCLLKDGTFFPLFGLKNPIPCAKTGNSPLYCTVNSENGTSLYNCHQLMMSVFSSWLKTEYKDVFSCCGIFRICIKFIVEYTLFVILKGLSHENLLCFYWYRWKAKIILRLFCLKHF